jgi:hypothetical protein
MDRRGTAVAIHSHHLPNITTKTLVITSVVFSHLVLTIALALTPNAPPIADTVSVYDAPVLSFIAWLGTLIKDDAQFFFRPDAEPVCLALILVLGSVMWGGIVWGVATIGQKFSAAKSRGRYR